MYGNVTPIATLWRHRRCLAPPPWRLICPFPGIFGTALSTVGEKVMYSWRWTPIFINTRSSYPLKSIRGEVLCVRGGWVVVVDAHYLFALTKVRRTIVIAPASSSAVSSASSSSSSVDKNFNLGHNLWTTGHNLWTTSDRTIIFHMRIPCDKTLHIIPWHLPSDLDLKVWPTFQKLKPWS